MLARDLVLVGPDEAPVAHDLLAADDQPVDAVRGREDEPRDGILGAAELEPVGPPDREVGALARLERADVVAAEHGRAAARAERGAPRGRSSPRGPPRPRATSSACLTSKKRSLALVRGGAVDAEPDAHARVEQVAHRRDAGAEAQVRRRAVRDAGAASRRSARSSSSREVDAVRAPDVAGEPAEPLEVLDRRAAVELAAVRLLLDRLGEVRVQLQPEPARERGRLLHQPRRDRERRARRDRELHACAGRRASAASRSVSASTASSVLDELVGRQAAVGLAEVHRAARGDDADAELARRLHLGLDEPGAPAREDVVVVEDRRAAGERELGEPGARGRVLRLRVDPRPDRVELAQPREEVGLLRPRARERLVEVVVRVDEPGRDDRAAEVDALVASGSAPAADAATRPSSTSSQPPLVLGAARRPS